MYIFPFAKTALVTNISIKIADKDMKIGFNQLEIKDEMKVQKILKILIKNLQFICNDVR